MLATSLLRRCDGILMEFVRRPITTDSLTKGGPTAQVRGSAAVWRFLHLLREPGVVV